MAAVIYRYRWAGLNVSKIKDGVDPVQPIVVTSVAPPLLIDIATDTLFAQADLDGVMLSLGWAFHSLNPTAAPQGLVLRSWNEAVESANVTTVSTVFVSLLSIPIIPVQEAGRFEISASITSTSLLTPNYFRLTLDGGPLPFSGFGHPIGLGNAAITQSILVAPGPHSVGLEWRVDPLGQADIRPVLFPDFEGCRLIVHEYSL